MIRDPYDLLQTVVQDLMVKAKKPKHRARVVMYVRVSPEERARVVKIARRRGWPHTIASVAAEMLSCGLASETP
jgi:hypothetical protein